MCCHTLDSFVHLLAIVVQLSHGDYWLVTTVTLLVAVRHQFTWLAVGVRCLCSGQQYSPPSPLQPALTFPPCPVSHSLQSTAAVNGMRGGGGRVPAGAADSRSHLLDSVTSFWEMKLDTALKNGYRLPGYRFTTLAEMSHIGFIAYFVISVCYGRICRISTLQRSDFHRLWPGS